MRKRKENRAAVVIQGLLKMIRAKKELARRKEQKHKDMAATIIQKMWRGYAARLRVKLMKFLTPFVITIQVRQSIHVPLCVGLHSPKPGVGCSSRNISQPYCRPYSNQTAYLHTSIIIFRNIGEATGCETRENMPSTLPCMSRHVCSVALWELVCVEQSMRQCILRWTQIR